LDLNALVFYLFSLIITLCKIVLTYCGITIEKILPPLAKMVPFQTPTTHNTTGDVIPNHRCQLLDAPAAAPMLQPQLLRSGRRRRQKGAPHVRRGQRRRQCKGVDNDDGGRTDFADAELADDARDVAAAAVARDLARGATIPTGGEGGGGRGGGSAGASDWLSRRLKTCRRRLSSSQRSAASCPLTHLLPFASCTPTPRLPLVCQLVVMPPLLSRRRQLRLATLPRPLLRHLVVATCNAPLVALPPPLVLWTPLPRDAPPPHDWLCRCPSLIRRCRCRRCAGVFAVIAIAIVALGDCRSRRLSLSWCHCGRQRTSSSSLPLYSVAPSPL
jgi:hypothetical protein